MQRNTKLGFPRAGFKVLDSLLGGLEGSPWGPRQGGLRFILRLTHPPQSQEKERHVGEREARLPDPRVDCQPLGQTENYNDLLGKLPFTIHHSSFISSLQTEKHITINEGELANSPTVERKPQALKTETLESKKKIALVFLLIQNMLWTPSNAFSQCGKTSPTCCNQSKTYIHPCKHCLAQVWGSMEWNHHNTSAIWLLWMRTII